MINNTSYYRDSYKYHAKGSWTNQAEKYSIIKKATTEDYSVVQKEDDKNLTRTLKQYNLDDIISIGYRVNSKRGVLYRRDLL